MDDSPVARVKYQREPSPVETVSYSSLVGHRTAGPMIVTPQRKQRKQGHRRRKVNSTTATNVNQPAGSSQLRLNYQVPLSSSARVEVPQLPTTPRTPAEIDSASPSFLSAVYHTPNMRSLTDIQYNESYISFVEAVLSDECVVYQLDRHVFIANGWNRKYAEAQGWYHLQRERIGAEYSVVCLCPDSRATSNCYHKQFMKDYGEQRFPPEDVLASSHLTYLFSRSDDPLIDNTFVNLFSVTLHPDYSSIKHRVVVEHRGDDTGGGTWKCFKCSNICNHITEARNTLQRLLKNDPNAVDCYTRDESYLSATPVRSAAGVNTSISYKSLPPPVWAQINADNKPPAVPAIRTVPSLIPVDPFSSCACNNPRSRFDPTKPTERRSCIIYGLLDASTTIIVVQKCPLCTHGYIGPDCTDIGIFNFNNRSLFTLTLLDDYTAHFTRSETPFVSWVASTACRYENFKSENSFINEKVFRAAWFSYVRLLHLDHDMCCPRCGVNPTVTIWDGVTLSFNRRNLLSSLKPPTSTDQHSEQKANVKLETGLQFIVDRSLRKDINVLLQGQTLELPPLPQDSDASPSQAVANMMERVALIPGVVDRLCRVDLAAGRIFDLWFGTQLLFRGVRPHRSHKDLFLQLSAEESALQLLNGKAIDDLENFLLRPSLDNLFLLRSCPALYNAVAVEYIGMQRLSQAMVDFMKWIFIRSNVVLSRLKKNGLPSVNPIQRGGWQQTGSCYGMPQIRSRPIYPSIPRDNSADLGGTDLRGEGCQKFYSTYGQNRLTGGLMCAWCPHSVCYGFHIIPYAEGRNDVFSAIYTHWDVAPSVIVYDFACALQPYCMTREPEFFANTLFVIDGFHAKGHSKCGKASFITNYLDTNPDLITVNSSAGECGNSGILRIRKSVSYMSQDRAVVYTKVFISIWNRHRIRKLESSL